MRLRPVLQAARRALQELPDCKALFGGTNVLDPIAALDSGRIKYSFANKASILLGTPDAGTSAEGWRPSLSPFGAYYQTALTNFNPGFWDASNSEAQLVTFLHELGHAIYFLSVGSITGGFIQNDRSQADNRKNDELVRAKCITPLEGTP